MRRGDQYFLLLLTLHSSLLVTSTIAGSKIFALPFGFSASATVFSYMLTFVMLDTVAELYGRQYSRAVINLSLIGAAISAAYFEFTILLPPSQVWPHQSAFETVLNSSWRIWLGGWIAYLLSQYLDLWSFLKLRELAWAQSLVLRAWISMLLGQLVDTVVFITISFYGSFPLGAVIFGQYIVKVIFATFAAPLVALAVLGGRRWAKQSRADAPGRTLV
jgi:uncharacterized integral membrane protein (TIGR00697 family)